LTMGKRAYQWDLGLALVRCGTLSKRISRSRCRDRDRLLRSAVVSWPDGPGPLCCIRQAGADGRWLQDGTHTVSPEGGGSACPQGGRRRLARRALASRTPCRVRQSRGWRTAPRRRDTRCSRALSGDRAGLSGGADCLVVRISAQGVRVRYDGRRPPVGRDPLPGTPLPWIVTSGAVHGPMVSRSSQMSMSGMPIEVEVPVAEPRVEVVGPGKTPGSVVKRVRLWGFWPYSSRYGAQPPDTPPPPEDSP